MARDNDDHDTTDYMMTEDSYMIPVIFHNLKGYDSNLIMQYITREYAPRSINVIPTSSEKLLSFQIGNLCFLDSLQFLTASLNTLIESLAADGNDKFSLTARHYPDTDLVFAKGNYPYEYMDGRDTFLFTDLPPIDTFYSSLSEETITPEEYDRAQKVWRKFGIENMQQYHDLYLNLDILLLADVFENFWQTCILDYGLDPEHYYTLPCFTFDACLKFIEQELDLFTDSEMFLFIEHSIRGGFSVVIHRHAKANNPLVPDYDHNSPTPTSLMWMLITFTV